VSGGGGAPYRQDAIKEALEAADGRVVPVAVLIERVYGCLDPDTERAFRIALARLRQKRPDLEIENVHGYRLGRPGRDRDRRGYDDDG